MQVQLVVLVTAFMMVRKQLDHFLLCCSTQVPSHL